MLTARWGRAQCPVPLTARGLAAWECCASSATPLLLTCCWRSVVRPLGATGRVAGPRRRAFDRGCSCPVRRRPSLYLTKHLGIRTMGWAQ